MPKYSNFAIVASFFCLWIVSLITFKAQTFVGFYLILSFGILHGSNDLLLISNINSSKITTSFIKTLIYYVVIVLLGAILFYLIPWFALSIFIIVSGYHFGEQQWQDLDHIKIRYLKKIFQLIYGMLILFLLFNFHEDEVQKVVFEITSKKIAIGIIPMVLKVILLFFISISLYLYISTKNFKKIIFTEIFYLIVFTIIFKVSSLIWGFAIYFIIWHSIPSIIDQLHYLYGKASYENFYIYFKSAFIYWLVSLIGIALFYFYLGDQKIFNALFFSFLAAITFPHVLVIIKMFEKKS